MSTSSLFIVLTIGSAVAVVQEDATEEWGSHSPTGNCHCEQTKAGGVHGHSPASFCDKGCPGGAFCSQFHCGGTRASPSLHGCAWLCAPPPPPPSPPPPPYVRHVISTPVVHHQVPPSNINDYNFGGWNAPSFTAPSVSFSHPDLHSFSGSAWNFLTGEVSAAQVSACLSPAGKPVACHPWGALPAVLGVGTVAIGMALGVAKLAKRSRTAVPTDDPSPASLL